MLARRSVMVRWSGFALILALTACRRAPTEARPAVAEPAPKPAAAAPPVVVEPAPPPAPATVEKLLVPGDSPASIVKAAKGGEPLTVFMGGMCSNAYAYLYSFREAAAKAGGVVAIEGDQPCGPGVSADYHTYSWDAGRQHARIEMALAAGGVKEIPKEGITLVGYSQGASLAEQLAARYPGRYSRIVLIGAPTDPSPASFRKTRALVTMACERDVTARMRQAAVSTNRAGTPATYFQMPGCTHGQVADGDRIFGDSFDWLAEHERPIDPSAQPIRIAGPG